MENKLLIKYENNFFNKIKKFFSKILKKEPPIVNQVEVIKCNKIEVGTKVDEFDKMKKASKKAKIKEDILMLIEGNPQLLDTLSIDKLKELDQMYDEVIEKNDRKIKQLQRELYKQ